MNGKVQYHLIVSNTNHDHPNIWWSPCQGAPTRWPQEGPGTCETHPSQPGFADQHRCHLRRWLHWQQSQSSWLVPWEPMRFGRPQGVGDVAIFGFTGTCFWHLQALQLLSQGSVSERPELHLLPLVARPAQGQSFWTQGAVDRPHDTIHGWRNLPGTPRGVTSATPAALRPSGGASPRPHEPIGHTASDSCVEGWRFGVANSIPFGFHLHESSFLDINGVLGHCANDKSSHLEALSVPNFLQWKYVSWTITLKILWKSSHFQHLSLPQYLDQGGTSF